jgi:hypothetical protein
MKSQDQRSGRHAGGLAQSRRAACRHWTRAALYGLFIGASLTLAGPISRIIFHHDYLGGHGLSGFVGDVLSLALAGVLIALIGCLMAAIWKRARRRFAGPSGRAADA